MSSGKEFLKEVTEAIGPFLQVAFEELKESAKDDYVILEAGIKKAFLQIVRDLENGSTLPEIADRYDTTTKALVAAAFFKLSKQQTQALRKAKSVLEHVGNLVLRILLLQLTGV